MCETYSGWTNRETWALMLWINNDEGLQSMAHDYVREGMTARQASAPARAVYQSARDSAAYDASLALQEWTETVFTRSGYVDHFGDSWPDALADIAEDIGSLYRINYYECAESILADMSIPAFA